MLAHWPTGQRIAYGGDYNPEQWPREIWHEDVALMKQAGVNLVSINIFAWAKIEPAEGVYDFTDLDAIIELLHENGIAIDLATPTAAPPAWFYRKYPQSRVVDRHGTTLVHGSRGAVAPSSPEYRQAAARIAGVLAERYGGHPAVVMWHVHNEYGAPVSDDYSENAERAFRVWLQDRYQTLDALNYAWGTDFWGQRYHQWEEIGTPRLSASVTNPAQRLDFTRFSDRMLQECFLVEKAAIQQYSDKPVTTNFMSGECSATDLFAWAKHVDIVSNDHYLAAEEERNYVGLAMAADLTRGFAGGKPWILMEHSTSAVNWQNRNIAKVPGEMTRNSLSHLARGADGVMFFQWRASRSGAEKFHSAMLPHAGTDSKTFREVTDLGARLRELAPVATSEVTARVAILWDQESQWALELEWRPSVDLKAKRQLSAFYERLWSDGVAIDFVHPSADLSSYSLVVAPVMYLLSTENAQNIRNYVSRGGHFVLNYFGAIVDQNDRVHPGAYASVLGDVLGLTIEDFAPLRQSERVELAFDGIEAAHATGEIWSDDINLDGADAIARYVTGRLAGSPAVTKNRFGQGTAWYIGTHLDSQNNAELFAAIYQQAGISPLWGAKLATETEVIVRRGENADFIFAINNSDHQAIVDASAISALYPELAALSGEISVPAGAVVVAKTDPQEPGGWSTI